MDKHIPPEIVRYGVQMLKNLAYVRIPPYELPADSFLEAVVIDIISYYAFNPEQNDE